MAERITYKEVDKLPEEELVGMFKPPEPSRRPERSYGILERLTGKPGRDRKRDAAERADAERRAERARNEILAKARELNAHPVKVAAFRGDKMVGFATAKEVERVHEMQPRVLGVAEIHAEGENPRIGVNMLRRMASNAEKLGVETVAVWDMPQWVEKTLKAEKERVQRKGKAPNILREIEIGQVRLESGRATGHIKIGNRSSPRRRK